MKASGQWRLRKEAAQAGPLNRTRGREKGQWPRPRVSRLAGTGREDLPERKGLAGRRRRGTSGKRSRASRSSPRLHRGCLSSAATRCRTARRKLAPASEILTPIRLLPGPLSKRTPARRAWPPLREDRGLTEGEPCTPVCPRVPSTEPRLDDGGTTVLPQKPVTPGQGTSENVRPGARRSVTPARSRGQGGDGQEQAGTVLSVTWLPGQGVRSLSLSLLMNILLGCGQGRARNQSLCKSGRQPAAPLAQSCRGPRPRLLGARVASRDPPQPHPRPC